MQAMQRIAARIKDSFSDRPPMSVNETGSPSIELVILRFHTRLHSLAAKIALFPVPDIDGKKFFPDIFISNFSKCYHISKTFFGFQVFEFERSQFGLTRTKD